MPIQWRKLTSPNLSISQSVAFAMFYVQMYFNPKRTTLYGGSSCHGRGSELERKEEENIAQTACDETANILLFFPFTVIGVRECVFVDLNNEFLYGQRFGSSTHLHRRKLIDKNIHTMSPCWPRTVPIVNSEIKISRGAFKILTTTHWHLASLNCWWNGSHRNLQNHFASLFPKNHHFNFLNWFSIRFVTL